VSGGTPVIGQADIDYNLYHNRAGSVTGPGAHSITSDPMFVDPGNGNFYLVNSSPACGAGDASIGPDIGAFFCGDGPVCIPLTTGELLVFINNWKKGDIEMNDLMEVISEWKSGC